MTVQDAINLAREVWRRNHVTPPDWPLLQTAVETLVARLAIQQAALDRDPSQDASVAHPTTGQLLRGQFASRGDVGLDAGDDASALPLVAQALARQVQENDIQLAQAAAVLAEPTTLDD